MNGYNAMGTRDEANPLDERITDCPIDMFDCELCETSCVVNEADMEDEYHMKYLCDECAEILWQPMIIKALAKFNIDIEDCKIDTRVDRATDTLEGFGVVHDGESGYMEFHCIPCKYLWTLNQA